MKRVVRKKPDPSFFERLIGPLRLVLILVLTFGISSVGRAAEKIKRTINSKKKNLKASYAALLTNKAWGYFHPIWSPDSQKDLPAPVAGLDNALDDSESRIERPFRVASSMKGRVSFWIDIYARFSSQFRVVHDKDNPELIYGYIDFSPLYRTMPERMARARAYQIEQRILKELKERVAEAMEVSRPKEPKLTPEEKQSVRDLMAKASIRNAEDASKPIRRIRSQTGQKDNFLKGLARSAKLLPEIEAIFREKGLPVALARLPFVESSFNPSARSKVGASGMWQFMPDTAKRFVAKGSKQNLSEPMFQSRSAARLFTILHEKFDDWGIAVTAYNSGATRLANMVERHGATNIQSLLNVPLGRGNLGFAGSNFYSEFLAAVTVEAYKDRIFSASEIRVSGMNLSRRIQSLFVHEKVEAAPVKVAEVKSKSKAVVKVKHVRHRAPRRIRSARAAKFTRTRVASSTNNRRRFRQCRREKAASSWS